jgi:hypothetical protein
VLDVIVDPDDETFPGFVSSASESTSSMSSTVGERTLATTCSRPTSSMPVQPIVSAAAQVPERAKHNRRRTAVAGRRHTAITRRPQHY